MEIKTDHIIHITIASDIFCVLLLMFGTHLHHNLIMRI